MSLNTNEFNEDELHPPVWLDENFLLEVLRHCENDIELLEFKITPASGKNDHYASIIFRVYVKYTIKSEIAKESSLIIKTMPEEDGHKKEFLKDLSIFETEIAMYTQIVPKFEEILEAASDSTKFGPSCLYHSLSPRKLIVFEDMVPHGYMVLRERQANNQETKVVFAKIAKWHAVSYKLNLEEPEFFRNYHHSAIEQVILKNNDFCADGITNFIEMLNDHEDLRYYTQYFEPLKTTILDYAADTFNEFTKNPQSNAYYVLCHGDFHLRNMLFKYDDDKSKLLDALLIDYQMCYIGPIVNDLINSTFFLIDSEQRQKNLDELHNFYFAVFQETLRKIGFKGKMPEIIELKSQMKKHRNFELFLFTTFLPLLFAIQDAENGIAELLTSAESRKSVFQNPVYVDEVRKRLPIYFGKGRSEN